MGTLFRKFCRECDGNKETNVTFDGFVGAVITGSQRGGEIVSEGYLAYLVDSGELVPLPHPMESYALEAAGGAWRHAAIHGRLLYIHNMICIDCGAENTTASLRTGGTGCILGLVTAAVAIAFNVLLFNFHLSVEFVVVYVAMFSPSLLIERYVAIRYAQNVKPHQTKRCARCGHGRIIPLSRTKENSLPCPRCNQRTMTIEIAGRS